MTNKVSEPSQMWPKKKSQIKFIMPKGGRISWISKQNSQIPSQALRVQKLNVSNIEEFENLVVYKQKIKNGRG